MAYMEEGEVLVPLDAMGGAYQRLAHHRRMGKYVQVSARCAIFCRLLQSCEGQVTALVTQHHGRRESM